MANHKSATKQHRQAMRRRARNRYHRARLRTQIKSLRKLIDAGETSEAAAMLPATVGMIDRTAKHGAINANMASRTKSRLSKALNRASA